jgi:hypothetical protein
MKTNDIALCVALLGLPSAALAADTVLQGRLAGETGNLTACLAMAPQFEREHTVTVSDKGVMLTAPGGLSARLDPVRPDVYRTTEELSGQRFEYEMDLASKTLTVRGNNLGCKWSGKFR